LLHLPLAAASGALGAGAAAELSAGLRSFASATFPGVE
jgi:hypothetical protein